MRYFVAIVEAGSLSRAANNVNVAQPALSQQMAKLEEELRTKLLNRTKLGVKPTTAGWALYRHAQAILRLVGSTRDVIIGEGNHVAGRVRLSMPSSMALMLASPLLQAVRSRYPQVRLELHEGPSGHLASQLLDERVDMSILVEPSASGGLRLLPLVDETLFFVGTTKKGRKLPSGPISIQGLADVPLVLPTRATTLRQILDLEFERAKVVPQVHAEASSIPTMLLLVEGAGVGTIVPSAALAHSSVSASLIVRQIEPAIHRTAMIAYSQMLPLSTASEHVRSVLQNTVSELIAAGRWKGASPPS